MTEQTFLDITFDDSIIIETFSKRFETLLRAQTIFNKRKKYSCSSAVLYTHTHVRARTHARTQLSTSYGMHFFKESSHTVQKADSQYSAYVSSTIMLLLLVYFGKIEKILMPFFFFLNRCSNYFGLSRCKQGEGGSFTVERRNWV